MDTRSLPDTDAAGRTEAPLPLTTHPGTVRQYLVFMLDDQRYALPLPSVDRVVRMVYVTPLSSAPDIVLGIVDVAGRIVPVVDTRKRFGLPERPIAPDDQLLVVHTGRRPVALVSNGVEGVTEYRDQDLVPATGILPVLPHWKGVMRTPEGLVLIHDVAAFLSLEESAALERVLKAPGG